MSQTASPSRQPSPIPFTWITLSVSGTANISSSSDSFESENCRNWMPNIWKASFFIVTHWWWISSPQSIKTKKWDQTTRPSNMIFLRVWSNDRSCPGDFCYGKTENKQIWGGILEIQRSQVSRFWTEQWYSTSLMLIQTTPSSITSEKRSFFRDNEGYQPLYSMGRIALMEIHSNGLTPVRHFASAVAGRNGSQAVVPSSEPACWR